MDGTCDAHGSCSGNYCHGGVVWRNEELAIDVLCARRDCEESTVEVAQLE